MKEEEKKEERNKVKQRELLYKLMISQLFYDGHQNFAQELATVVEQEPSAISPSDRLMNIISIGIQHEHELERPLNRLEYTLGPGLDLEYETEPQTSAPEPAMYETAYVTSHKDKCRAAAFSMDGSLVATGSVDASIKILDVDRMLAKSDPDAVELHPDAVVGHPVIRTLYDHLDEITCLEFHPREQILISGSRDTNIKMFDFSKTSAKKAFKTLTDAEQVTSMSIHPSGDFLAVTTEGPVVRFYDINTGQCYVCPYPREHHTGPLTSVRYSADARVCASASKDGDIKVWDGVSGRCVQTFTKCHDGAEVCSVLYSRNGKYILSSGLDSIVKLWELSTGRCLIAYTGAGSVGRQEHSAHAMFNHTEDFVMFPDEATTSLCAWDARNAQRKNLLSLGMEGEVCKRQGQRWLRPATDKEEYFAVGHTKCGYGLSAYSISLTSSKPLTEDLIKRALVHLYKKVPVLRLCLGQREGRLWLREMNECILDFKVEEDGVESEVEERLMYHAFNTEEGPMWCVRFIPATQGHGGVVILCFHHTATDGISNIRICNLLHIILDDLIAERHIDDKEQFGEHMGDEEAKVLYETERQRLAQDPDLYKRRKEELTEVDNAHTPLLSVLNYPYDKNPKTCSAKLILDEATTQAFRQTCRSNGVTLHSGLIGVVNVALLRMLEDLPNAPPEYNFVCSHDVGLRRYYKGDTSRILGLHLPTFSYRMSFITPKDLIHRFWPYVREYNDRFHADLKDKAPLQTVILRLLDKSKEDNFTECFGQKPQPEYSYAISNTGDASLMIPGNGDFVQVTKLGRMSTVRELVVPMCFFVHTYRGRLNITMGYSTHFLTRNIAQQLLSFLHEAMKQLCH